MNENKNMKRLPYGNSNFKDIILNNYVYVDKTRYIEMLENEANRNQLFIRPRKFGKSLFLTTLMSYYDINEAENFDRLFGNLYIGKHPTPKRNTYAVISFDFSGLDTGSEERFTISFSNRVQDTVRMFLEQYRHVFREADLYIRQIDEEKPGIRALTKMIAVATGEIRIFVIIDEYDQFANDLIAKGTSRGKDMYKIMVTANGLVRDFYEQIKTAAGKAMVYRTFITGISPMMLDDMTSGYNIASNLTLNPKYNEMLGFTQSETEWLMNETGVDPDLINIDMEAYYNGYRFNPDGENRVYNPTMVLYIFDQILNFKKITEVIDENIKMDYSRLRNLIRNENNREALIKIIEGGGVTVSEILKQFSVDQMNDSRHFVSLLFYLGLLTIKELNAMGRIVLCIPNYSIRTLYWEYLARLMNETSPNMRIETSAIENAIGAMAMEGDLKRFISYISENAFSRLSDHDLRQFDEKYIKILLLAYLFMSKTYIAMSEYETVPGRTDIFLQRNPISPHARYEWILELKYCKVSATKSEIDVKRKEAFEQIDKYINAYRIKGRPDLKAAVIVFVGKDKFEITEVFL
ncbi:MAG: ATP-binding protein [Tannerella sp.]|jgi:hypothetical protein|nr:ATP-binding protein [Tannerella sp.]